MGASPGSRASTEPSSTVSALTGFDPARLKLERYDRDCTRIVDGGGGAIIALIEALSNGRWIISDLHDQQIVGRSFGTVRLAFAWFRSGAFEAALASGMSASGRDRETGHEAQPASPIGKAGDAQSEDPQ